MKLKCTLCGSNSLKLIDNKKIFEPISNNALLTIYKCNKCGHLEFFSASPIQNKAIKELEEVLNGMKMDLKKKLSNKAPNSTIKNLKETIKELEKNINDLKKDII